MLHIRLLGGFDLRYNEDRLMIQGARMHSFLSYLLLHPEMPHPRQQLAFLFWPDSSEAQAQTNLRKLIYQLRNLLPDSDTFLHLDQRTIQWQRKAPYKLDVEELGHLLQQNREFAFDGTHLRRIVDLYAGQLLPSVYDDWVVPLRQRFHREVRQTLEQLITSLENQRAYEDGIAYAQRLLELDPAEEAPYRHLMRLQALKGDRSGVVRAYRQYVKMLQQELGVEPSAETQRLYTRLINSEPMPGTASLQSETIPLVGRRQEWSVLQEAWRRSMQGHAQLVAVTGEAGIGKTRLAEELLRWASTAGAVTVRARSYSAQGALAYAPITEVLRSESVRAGYDKLAAVWRTEVARLVPELLAEDAKLPTPEPMREGWQRQRFWEALARAIRGDGKQPLYLLLDDLQWCDHETLAWLQYLLHDQPLARLLVVGTVRDDEVAPEHPFTLLQVDLQRSGHFTQITLGALNAGDSRELARQVAHESIAEALVEQVNRDAEGNPLFIIEIMRSQSVTAGSPSPDMQVPERDEVVNRPNVLPPKVYATIRHRLLHLSAPAQELIGIAATIGRAFTFEMLAAMSQNDGDLLADVIDELWRRRIVRQQGEGYDFSHDRIRDVAYASLSPIRRQRLQLRAAEMLETLYSTTLDDVTWQIATHFEQAGNVPRALPYIRRAAVVAQRIYAYEESIRFLRHGIELVERLMPSKENDQVRLELLTHLAFMLIETRGTASTDVREVYEKARKLSNLKLTTPANFTLLHGMSSYYRVHAEYSAVVELASHLLTIAQESQNSQHLVAAHFELGAMYFLTGELLLARSHLEQSARLCTSNQSYARPHSILAEVLLMLGYPEQAFVKYREALVQVRGHATPFDIVSVLGDTIELRLVARSREALEEDIAEFRKYVRKHGYPQHDTWASFLQGWSLVDREGMPMVVEMESGVRRFQAIGGRTRMSRFLGLVAEHYFYAGAVEKAEALWAEAMRHMEEHSERFWEAGLYRLKSEIVLYHDSRNLVEAEGWLLRAINVARGQHSKMLELRAATSLCRLWLGQDRRAEASALLFEVYAWFTEGFDTPDLLEAKAVLEQ